MPDDKNTSTGDTNDAQTGPAGASGATDNQTGAGSSGPAGATGASGPSGAAQTGAAQTGAKTPEKYDLKLPKDSLLEASAVDRIAAEAKERGLTNDQAQELLERENAATSRFSQGQQAKHKETVKLWGEQSKNDKEIGGEAFAQNAELAKRVVDKYFPELKTVLEETGYGNYPDFIRGFVRLGKAMSPDKLEMPGAEGGKKDAASIMYPNRS